jgi:hypothetical protein
MGFLSLYELPVDALWKKAALHDRRNWNMAVKLATPSEMRRSTVRLPLSAKIHAQS